MAIKFIQTGDELPLHSATSFDDDSAEGFWGGVFKCAATLALAASVTLASFQTTVSQTQWTYEQNEPGALHGQFDEDFWVTAQFPSVTATLGPLYLPDPEELPAGSLFGLPHEDDSWQPPILNTGNLYQSLPLTGESEVPQQPVVTFQPDEDFWQNPTAPTVGNLAYPQQWAFEQNESGALFGNPFEDDSWQPPILNSGVLYQALPLGGESDVPQAVVAVLGIDEDFWQNPVAPQPGYLFQLLPIGADIEIERVIATGALDPAQLAIGVDPPLLIGGHIDVGRDV